jgi:hypothetical protein
VKVLLDECLPRPLKRELTGHDVSTVPEMGWAGVKNGELLALMEPLFDVFVTIDGNMRYQQTLQSFQIAFVVLKAPDNKIETLRPLAPRILEALPALAPGDIVHIVA